MNIRSCRKKPVTIQAVQWTGHNGMEIHIFTEAAATCDEESGLCRVNTLEGVMGCDPGAYIIKGVAGEFYPCKEDIFIKTYEEV